MSTTGNQLEEIVTAVLKSSKYQHVSPELIRQIGEHELAIRKNKREAVKATKTKLHQVGGSYFETQVDYDRAASLVKEAVQTGSTEHLRQTCRELMRLHASTNERLEILDEFYSRIFSNLPTVKHVLDIACGFNPLALPWMPLGNDFEYTAYDIYADLINFINRFFIVLGVPGKAQLCNVLTNPPSQSADLAFLLKAMPCLEQVDKRAVGQLLENIQARYLLISYPVRSLGGYQKGMIDNYSTQFYSLVENKHWLIERFEFKTELAFLVDTGKN